LDEKHKDVGLGIITLEKGQLSGNKYIESKVLGGENTSCLVAIALPSQIGKIKRTCVELTSPLVQLAGIEDVRDEQKVECKRQQELYEARAEPFVMETLKSNQFILSGEGSGDILSIDLNTSKPMQEQEQSAL